VNRAVGITAGVGVVAEQPDRYHEQPSVEQ
jgi:hypothetical protein